MDIVKWNQINIKRCYRRKGWTAIGYIFSSFCVVCISFEHTVFAQSNEKGCQTIRNITLSILKSITQKKLNMSFRYFSSNFSEAASLLSM